MSHLSHSSTSTTAPYPLRWAALAVLSLALLLTVMANTALTVLVGDVQEDLSATASQSRWVLDAYPLVVAALLLPLGALGDRHGRRGALLAGLVIFVGASIAATLADSPATLIAARATLGVGGALIMPATLAYVRLLFPPAEQGRAFAIWSASSGIALVAGPLIAGALLDPLGWHGAFWINVVIGTLLVLGVALLVPASRNPDAPPADIPGAALSCLILGPLTYGVIEAPNRGWTSAVVLGAFALSAVALIAFVAWERRVAHPMLDLHWFSQRSFGVGAGLTVLGFTTVVGILYLSVLYLQQHEVHGALRTGIELIPLGGGILLGAILVEPLVARVGRRIPVVIGCAAVVAGCVVFAQLGDDSGYGTLAIALALAGIGAGAFLPNVTEAVMGSVTGQAGGVAGATADAAVEFGAALGIALLGSVASTVYRDHLPDAIHQLPTAAAEAIGDSYLGAHIVAEQLPAQQATALLHSAGSAFIDGLAAAGWLGAGIAAIAALVAFTLPARETPR